MKVRVKDISKEDLDEMCIEENTLTPGSEFIVAKTRVLRDKGTHKKKVMVMLALEKSNVWIYDDYLEYI